MRLLRFARPLGQRCASTSSERLQIIREASPEEDVRRFLGRELGRRVSRQLPGSFEAGFGERMQQALTDRFGRHHSYLRVSLTERCSLRCTYCMPEAGVELSPAQDILSSEEIVHIVEAVAAGGVSKVRLTGGEPLVRKDWAALARSISLVPGIEEVSLTTNAVALSRTNISKLVQSGVTSVNVSLDTVDPKKFESLARRPSTALTRALEAVRDLAAIAGARARPDAAADGFVSELAALGKLRSVKINAVALRGVSEGDLSQLAALSSHFGVSVRFIEAMPFQGNSWSDDASTTTSLLSMEEILGLLRPDFPNLSPSVQGLAHPSVEAKQAFDVHSTARLWHVGKHSVAIPGSVPAPIGPGPDVPTVGIIASMTAPFCGGCNRLRLTADGNIKACLFGTDEVPLRDALRIGSAPPHEAVLRAMATACGKKHFQLGGFASPREIRPQRPMIKIGG
jgi:molybdenum cofactor biosynthesis enzyme MoaA